MKLMTEMHPQMRDSQMSIDERISRAHDRISKGYCNMRIPAEATDPDIVLHDCAEELRRLRSEIALRDRALQWCLINSVYRSRKGEMTWDPGERNNYTILNPSELPADIAALISGKADSEVER